MRQWVIALGAAAGLAACAGPSGGLVAPGTPSGAGSQPSTAAVTMTYAQTSDAQGGGGIPGFTCATPEYPVGTPTVGEATIVQTVTPGQAFDGRSGLIAVTGTSELQGCSNGAEPVTQTDYYASASTGTGSSDVLPLIGSTERYADVLGNASALQTLYAAGNVGLTATLQGANSNETLVVHDDGSYIDTAVATGGTLYPYDAVTLVENGDGSGSRTVIEGANASAPPYVYALSAPDNGIVSVSTSGTPPIDPVLPTPSPCATPCPAPTAAPQVAWYPFDPSPSAPLERVSTTDKGRVQLPSACSASANFPTAGELIETVDSKLDIWRGTTDTTSDAYVDARDGVLCLHVTISFADYVLGPTSADQTPVSRGSIVFTDSLKSESAPPNLPIGPAIARSSFLPLTL